MHFWPRILSLSRGNRSESPYRVSGFYSDYGRFSLHLCTHTASKTDQVEGETNAHPASARERESESASCAQLKQRTKPGAQRFEYITK